MANDFDIQTIDLPQALRGDASDVEARPCYPFTTIPTD